MNVKPIDSMPSGADLGALAPGPTLKLNPFLAKVREFAGLMSGGHAGGAARMVLGRLYSRPTALGLARDLSQPVAIPAARIPFTIRPLQPGDDLSFLHQAPPGEGVDAAVWRLNQLRFIEAGIPTCYVAVTGEGRICYIQWLVSGRDMPRMVTLFGNIFPEMADDEGLLEGAYTPPDFRGQKLMSAAMTLIAGHGIPRGMRRIITFVGDDNIGSLKGCKNAGFSPALRRTYTFLMFRRFVDFKTLPAGTPYSFDNKPVH